MKKKHGTRRARLAAKARGETPPPIGKRARLAAAPRPHTIVMVIGTPKLATPPAIQAPVSAAAKKTAAPIADPRATPLEDMGLTPVVSGILKQLGLHTAGAVSDHGTKIPGMAKKRNDEVRATLATLGLPCNLP